MAIDDIQIGKLIQVVETIKSSIVRIEDVVFDSDGLVARTARVEETAKQLKEESARDAAFQESTLKALGEIKTIVAAHSGDTSLHSFQGLLLKGKTLTYLFLALLTIHSLIPADLNVFELIKKVFGL